MLPMVANSNCCFLFHLDSVFSFVIEGFLSYVYERQNFIPKIHFVFDGSICCSSELPPQ